MREGNRNNGYCKTYSRDIWTITGNKEKDAENMRQSLKEMDCLQPPGNDKYKQQRREEEERRIFLKVLRGE